jgi:hypothetical protein
VSLGHTYIFIFVVLGLVLNKSAPCSSIAAREKRQDLIKQKHISMYLSEDESQITCH